ncbi:hypothetical protein DJ031_06730 [bacterium endosymbiont of Escarpia laminata]|nr:MAG: hypothetical protein DJ031_06730 [bacterium endosymbiont of Escarpia laminata]
MIQRNEKGFRVGESHQKARLSDVDVDLMRELHEVHGLKKAVIARKFNANYFTVCAILNYKSRVQWNCG